MATSTLFRFGGLAAILSGVFTAIGWLVPGNVLVETFNIVALGLLPLALTGIYLRQRVESGTFGLVGYIIAVFGGALVMGAAYSDTYVLSLLSEAQQDNILMGSNAAVFMASGVTILVGTVLFGIVTIIAGVFPRVAAVLIIIGTIPLSLVPLFEDVPIVLTIGAIVLGMGLGWLGYSLWQQAEVEVKARA